MSDEVTQSEIYFCTRCETIVQEGEHLGEFYAGKCLCDRSPSPWQPVSERWSGLLSKFRPGGTDLPKTITLARPLVRHAKSVSPTIARELFAYLDAAYARLAHRRATEAKAEALVGVLKKALDYILTEAEKRDFNPAVPGELLADIEYAIALASWEDGK